MAPRASSKKNYYEGDGLSLFSRELQKWLFFRLMNGSGVGKFINNCPAWWNLSAIYWHLPGQPIPHIGAYWAHQVPDVMKQLLSAITLYVMAFLPFLLYVPIRSVRIISLLLLLGTLFGITMAGNFNFFTILTICLGLNFLDDQVFVEFCPIFVKKILGIHDDSEYKEFLESQKKTALDDVFLKKSCITGKFCDFFTYVMMPFIVYMAIATYLF